MSSASRAEFTGLDLAKLDPDTLQHLHYNKLRKLAKIHKIKARKKDKIIKQLLVAQEALRVRDLLPSSSPLSSSPSPPPPPVNGQASDPNRQISGEASGWSEHSDIDADVEEELVEESVNVRERWRHLVNLPDNGEQWRRGTAAMPAMVREDLAIKAPVTEADIKKTIDICAKISERHTSVIKEERELYSREAEIRRRGRILREVTTHEARRRRRVQDMATFLNEHLGPEWKEEWLFDKEAEKSSRTDTPPRHFEAQYSPLKRMPLVGQPTSPGAPPVGKPKPQRPELLQDLLEKEESQEMRAKLEMLVEWEKSERKKEK